jgi:acetylornithine deacetylase
VKAAEILRLLVAIPSPSAVSNIPLVTWVANHLQAKGWRVELFPYTDEKGVDKSNLIARPRDAQSAAPVDLAFVCHTDTVPFAANWTNALNLHMDAQSSLHGCGACDVKGALSCFLAALNELRPEDARADVALILTADEEIGCKGVERLLSATNLRIRSAIVSEPTSLRPGVAGKGYGLARVTVHGIEAHSAYPSEGLSAITVAARFIARIEETEIPPDAGRDHSAHSDELFDPPRSTVNVGLIQGGSAKNIVAGECSFLVEWRPIPADSPRSMLARLDSLASRMMAEEPRARLHVECLRAESGFSPAADGPLQRRLAEIASKPDAPARAPFGISFGSEATRLARVADEVIVIGPGDMHTAHSDRECVPVAELEEWTETLRKLLTQP